MGQSSSRQTASSGVANRTRPSGTARVKRKTPADTCARTTSSLEHPTSSRRHDEPQPRHLRPTDGNSARPHKSPQTKNPLHDKTDSIPSNPSPQRRSHQTRDCTVCTDTRSLHRFPQRPPTAQCTHPIDVCRRCLRTWIGVESTTKMWDALHCPTCSTQLDCDDVREFASAHVFQRYSGLHTRAALEAIPGFRWCTAPACTSGQVHDGARARFCCAACRTSHCVVHGVKWHRGETCSEYEARTRKKLHKVADLASRKLIKDMSKSCPGCKRRIEKNGGCDHITCLKCRHEFCWVCKAPYVQSRCRVHRSGCIYFKPEED